MSTTITCDRAYLMVNGKPISRIVGQVSIESKPTEPARKMPSVLSFSIPITFNLTARQKQILDELCRPKPIMLPLWICPLKDRMKGR
jgi:hypothetical protein